MAEESFPVIEQPMSADQWRSVTLGIGDGILDQGGFPYRLASLSNSANTAVVRASTVTGYSAAILKGFYHKIDADVTIDLPAVTSRTTYHVALQYDPLASEMPVKLKVLTSLDRSGGKEYLRLHSVTRDPNQILTDASVRMIRPRVAPVQVYASESDMPPAKEVLWGTLALIHNGRSGNNAVLKMAITGDDGESTSGWFWKTVYDPNDNGFTWATIADTGTYKNPGHGFARAIGRKGKTRKLRGRVSRAVAGSRFNPGTGYAILSGSVANADTPAAVQRFTVATGGTTNLGFAAVEVSSSGDVTAWVDSPTDWIGLDGIEWEAR